MNISPLSQRAHSEYLLLCTDLHQVDSEDPQLNQHVAFSQDSDRMAEGKPLSTPAYGAHRHKASLPEVS